MFLSAGAAVSAQSITFQPYLTFDWDAVFYDPISGLTAVNARAFNFTQAGIKVTAAVDRVSAYAEVRGFPSGSTQYNEYDGSSAAQVNSLTRPVYYAWGKYQATPDGNLWAGKFKPAFGPVLFDASQFGIGWQRKLAGGGGSHTLSGFVLQPGVALNSYYPLGWAALAIPAHDGLRLLVLDEYYAKTLFVTGGAAYDYLGGGYSKLYLNGYAAWTGVPRLTLSAEAALAFYIKEDGIVKDPEHPEDADGAGAGFGLYAAAEYRVSEPVSAGLSLKLVDPLIGAARSLPGNGKNVQDLTEGEFSAASLGLFARFAPARDFYIQPDLSFQFANTLNGADPSDKDGREAGVNCSLTFRWEPRIRLGQ
jgi:hypothetical protein